MIFTIIGALVGVVFSTLDRGSDGLLALTYYVHSINKTIGWEKWIFEKVIDFVPPTCLSFGFTFLIVMRQHYKTTCLFLGRGTAARRSIFLGYGFAHVFLNEQCVEIGQN